MKPEVRRNKDFWAGLMLIGIGAAALFIARDYRFGSALRMGPGFFPTILSVILMVFGVGIMAVGLRRGEKIQGSLSLRALVLLPSSLVLFGILMELAGFIPALVALVFLAAASGRAFKFVEVLLMTALLTVASVALFIWGLGLPYPLIKGF
ncbi:MAG TPA: tripartite tricarboxylate transporter TctB family protein [Candidatus Methylomirabilis sp.]|nr:tripartite tricarboxylate transporter TctB family protein [Candidatus Methylomirabilis sp.]